MTEYLVCHAGELTGQLRAASLGVAASDKSKIFVQISRRTLSNFRSLYLTGEFLTVTYLKTLYAVFCAVSVCWKHL